jgi:cell division protein FtsZ
MTEIFYEKEDKIYNLDSFTPTVCVIGVGGGGCNAINNMEVEADNIKFIAGNTDAQSLAKINVSHKIQLGKKITRGLGAGANPEVGKGSAEENIQEIQNYIQGADLLFLTCGMGGGTGTGATPVIAKLAKELGILTIAIVTEPFTFEGQRRAVVAQKGIEELSKYVDTLIVVSNQNLFRITNERTSLSEAFKIADDVLKNSIKCISDLLFKPGFINLDFADMRTVMKEQGRGMISYGESTGESRGIIATELAISNPLISGSDIADAKNMLINISGGDDMTLFEVDEVVKRIKDEAKGEINLFFGSVFDETLKGSIRVSVIATGVNGGMKSKTATQEDKVISKENAKSTAIDEPSLDFKSGGRHVFERTNNEFQKHTISPIQNQDTYNEVDSTVDATQNMISKLRDKFLKDKKSSNFNETSPSEDLDFVVSFDDEN